MTKRYENWKKNYDIAKEYYKKFGTINVPRNLEYGGIKLGQWVQVQRLAKNGTGKWVITNKQIKMLEKLDINWGTRTTKENRVNAREMNTKYMESSTREATVTHVLNLLTSVLTRADIQSTITPDEGRNVPWHMYNIEACDTAKQALVGMDGLMDMIQLKDEGPLRDKARELKGLSYKEASVLLACEIPEKIEEVYKLAEQIKKDFYGNRIVMFAPLYLSNYCVNGCVYCPYIGAPVQGSL